MSAWVAYVRGTNGSDSNDGLSYALAFKTLAVAVAAAVTALSGGATSATINCTEQAIGGAAVTATVSNLTIKQHDNIGLERFVWIGATALTAGSWTTTGTADVYDYATGLTTLGAANRIVPLMNYLASTNGRGSHYGAGALLANDAAVNAGNSGTAMKYFFTHGTGVLKAYCGGADPRTQVTHIVNRYGEIAIELTGTANAVDGLHFKAWHHNGQGALVWLKDVTSSSRISYCKSWDGNNHAFVISGQSVAMAHATIEFCSSYGCAPAGAHITFFQQNGFGNTVNLRCTSCLVERHSWLNIDQTETAACSQQAVFSHASAGTPMRDLLVSRLATYDQAVTVTPVIGCDNQSAPASETVYGNYHFKLEDCVFENLTCLRTTGYVAMARPRISVNRGGSSAANRFGTVGMICAAGAGAKLFIEAGAILLDFDGDAGQWLVGFGMYYNTSAIHLRNCSVYGKKTSANGGAAQLGLFYNTSTTAAFSSIGSALSFSNTTGDTTQGFYSEGTNESLTLDDNAWGLFPSGVAHGSAGAIQGANPGSITPSPCADAHARDLDANFFVSADDLRVATGSALYGLKRQTPAPVPAAMIDGAFDGGYGAYTFGVTRHRTPPRVRAMIRDHNARVWRAG